MRIFTTCLLLGAVSTAAIAQDQPNTILVMDGSGSMWGQIDGIAKITIAQDVVSGLLEDFPKGQGLGLTVYGHRERGSCTDIETIVAPGPGTVGEIVSAVNGIKPLGKTPMTDAVIAAAEALRYTEDTATVILISDGVETCNPDPCAAARLLEEAGIDFTAHVVGFDVSDPEALAQMQCIADETGGQFLTASNADELDLAMTAMVMEPTPEPEPALVSMTFTAVIGEGKTLIDTPILWDINDGTGPIVEDAQANPFIYDLPEGAYTATAYSIAGEETGDAQFVAISGGNTSVEVMFEEKLPTARIIAPASAPAGSTVQVGWDGPDLTDDYVGVGLIDATGTSAWDNFFYTRDGNPQALLMPTEPSDYVIQYFQGEGRAVIGTASITLTPVEGSIVAPSEAVAGSEFAVSWTGPNYDGDYIGIGEVDATGTSQWKNFVYTEDGSDITLVAPADPGDYLIQYFLGQDRSVLVTQEITLTDVVAGITAPSEATVGASIDVSWTGPDYEGDYIGIGKPDASGTRQWENFFYTEGTPTQSLTMPTEPGEYLIQYFVGQDRTTIASQTITLVPVTAQINAPAEAIAGGTISVTWAGPDYDGDYVGIGQIGASGTAQWANFFYTEGGATSDLLVPTEPGAYEISYFLGQDRSKLITQAISVVPVKASITAPTTAVAGSRIAISFEGPDYEGDYIGIGLTGASGTAGWENYVYTENGAEAEILVPIAPGTYEISYFLGQGRDRLFTTQIDVTAVTARLIAPDTGAVGAEFVIGWDGPDYEGDYIGIGKTDASGTGLWESYAYTNDGNPLTVTLPDESGDYLVQYFTGQGRVIIGSRPLKIE